MDASEAHTPLADLRGWRAYHRLTRTATYGFVGALPLLLLYEVLIAVENGHRVAQVRVAADIWLKQLFAFFGGSGVYLMAIPLLVVGLVIFIAERKKSIPLRPVYLLWIVGESAVYAVVTAIVVSTVVAGVFAFALAPAATGPQVASIGTGMKIALSIGAGIYEELVFRVILVGGLFWLLSRGSAGRNTTYLLAAVIGAVIFSAVHYTGVYGDAFTLTSFAFRFLFGLVLNALFLVRGFAVAAWTHALYDVMVVTGLLGA